MTQRELVARMTADELIEWRALYALEAQEQREQMRQARERAEREAGRAARGTQEDVHQALTARAREGLKHAGRR